MVENAKLEVKHWCLGEKKMQTNPEHSHLINAENTKPSL